MGTDIFGKYYSEFYKRSFWHFLFSVAGAALFVLGFEFTKGPKGESHIPYFFSAMVLAGLHFIQTLGSLILYQIRTKGCSEMLKLIYLLVIYAQLPWGIIGASITGNAGICTGDNPCYYTENVAKNRIVCAFIIVLHVLSFVFHFIVITITVEESRIEPAKKPFSLRPLREENDKDFKTELNKPNEDIKSKDRQTDMALKLKRQMSLLDKKIKLTAPGVQRHRSADDSSLLSQSRKADSSALNEVKPLPPTNRKLQLYTIGQAVTTVRLANKLRQKRNKQNFSKDEERSETRLSSSFSEDELAHYRTTPTKLKRKQKSVDESRENVMTPKYSTGKRLPRLLQPHVPPPSYDDVMSTSRQDLETQPYWIPPLPRHESVMRRIPDNIYTGHSYPDTELAPVQPEASSQNYFH